MRKLLLRTNYLILIILLFNCQVARLRSREKNVSDNQVFEEDNSSQINCIRKRDSVDRKKVITGIENDSIAICFVNLIRQDSQKTIRNFKKRIEHSSDSRIKLDSIKESKGKLKNK